MIAVREDGEGTIKVAIHSKCIIVVKDNQNFLYKFKDYKDVLMLVENKNIDSSRARLKDWFCVNSKIIKQHIDNNKNKTKQLNPQQISLF